MSDEIERIPSMRRPARQGLPKRTPHDMARPMAEAGKTREVPPIPPREPTIARPLHDDVQPASDEPVIAEPEETVQPEAVEQPQATEQAEPEPMTEPQPVVEQEPETIAAGEPEGVTGSEAEPLAEPESLAQLEPEPEPAPVDPNAPPLTMREMFARVEPAFEAFRDAAYAYPAEHMNDRIGEEGWSRKQMLSHIAAWHDLTADRLIKMGLTGQPVPLDRDQEAINNAAARVAMGKSVGEVLKDVEASYARLRRQMLRMTDADLRLGEGWAAERIAGNTYAHYEEHMPDLVPPAPPPGTQAQQR